MNTQYNFIRLYGHFLIFTSIALYGCGSDPVDYEVFSDPMVLEEKILPITVDNIDTEIDTNQNILIHFTSYDSGCPYCAMSNPFVNKLATINLGKLTVGRITWNPWYSVRDAKKTNRKFNITGLPFLLFYKNGKLVWRHEGFDKDEMDKIMKKLRQSM